MYLRTITLGLLYALNTYFASFTALFVIVLVGGFLLTLTDVYRPRAAVKRPPLIVLRYDTSVLGIFV